MRLVLLGPPGAGKGTQAERICRDLGLLHLSTGELLRTAVREGTALGGQAKGYMDRGALVPDALVIALVRERMAQSGSGQGFLLDGFPRNTSQAKALDLELGSDGVQLVLHVRANDEEIVRRLLARGRGDDREEVIRDRLKVYAQETRPLVALYQERGILRTVDGTGSVDQVYGRIQAVLKAFQAGSQQSGSGRTPGDRSKASRTEAGA